MRIRGLPVALPSLLLALFCSRHVSSAQPVQSEPDSGRIVYQAADLAGLKSYELGELVALLLPEDRAAAYGWDAHVDDDIRWLTDGWAEDQENEGRLVRVGLARVNVLGQVSTVLRQHREELPWTIRYASLGNPALGVETIEITPGTPDRMCWGTLYDGCTFRPQKSLKHAGLSVERICGTEQPEELGPERVVYQVSLRGRVLTMVEYQTTCGASYCGSALKIHIVESAESLCR